MTRLAGRNLAEQFPIGTYFAIEGRDHTIWHVTDVGPPHALAEHVFDEDDQLVMRRVEAP